MVGAQPFNKPAHMEKRGKEVAMMQTVNIVLSMVFAFFIPIFSAMVVKRIVDKKPYILPLIPVSLFLAFIVRALFLYSF